VKDLFLKVLGLVFKNFVHVVLGVLLLIIAALGYSMFKQHQALTKAKNDLVGQKDAYQQLSSTYAKLETDYVSEKSLAEQAKKNWQNELAENKKLKDQLRGLASATFSVSQTPVVGAPDKLVPGPDGYLYQEITYQDAKGKQGPPTGFVKVANQTGVVTSKLFDHDIQIETAIAVDPKSGKVEVFSKGYYVLREPSLADTDPSSGKTSWKDVRYPLNITGGSLVYSPGAPPAAASYPSRFLVAPHLNAGVFAALTTDQGVEEGAHVDVTWLGYGRTKNDLDFKFVGLGTDFNKNYGDVSFVPVSYRVPFIPLISNLWVSPTIGLDVGGKAFGLTVEGTL